ncbi:hypothetical protein [Beijerinckia mobilis]|uniref:hypothetical protein n=1 Tax=Beijerinckia mobilis TaxID=231434 RepID=UPI001AEC0A31|nr:hypothetical protein [Beijerinckia mobilis]
MAVALRQPHRRGDCDQALGDALGRFVRAHGLRQELIDAGETYARLLRRWRLENAVPLFENRTSHGPAPDPLSRGENDDLRRQVVAMEMAMHRAGPDALAAVKRLAVEGKDIDGSQVRAAMDGLMALATHLRMVRAQA